MSDSKDEISRFYNLYFLVIAFLLIFVVLLGSADESLRTLILQEDGIIENLSVIGYFACVFLMFRALGKDAEKYWDIIIVLFSFGLRELDFHSRFTKMGMTKIRFFTSSGIPVYQKIIAAFCGCLILYCIVRIVRKHFSSFAVSLKKLEPSAVCIATGLAFILFSLALDGLSGKMLKLNIEIGPVISGFGDSAEELFELGIPIMFALSLKPVFDKSKRAAQILSGNLP